MAPRDCRPDFSRYAKRSYLFPPPSKERSWDVKVLMKNAAAAAENAMVKVFGPRDNHAHAAAAAVLLFFIIIGAALLARSPHLPPLLRFRSVNWMKTFENETPTE